MINDMTEHMFLLQRAEKSRRLYALVDGAQYERFYSDELYESKSIKSLFEHSEDRKIAFAGPWLLDISTLGSDWLKKINALELKYPSVSWLLSSLAINDLALHLNGNLKIVLPNNEIGMLRYYDPRVLIYLPDVLTKEQLQSFTTGIVAWGFLYEDEYHYII
ncbi:TPA: DUF4123 domain-containing protein [Enterobacter asburiae]|jgi:hypothetical protein|uniref:DUF4123 domain-containing protein n=1 Tax=Enterobacter asburiae TaxID=61645 RepID=UPI001A92AC26|nr:DUF4123 domain-containing protein [Enterobacter asburiae]ELQ7876434.1 DUF4123 domain-containing protein [Enterobacter asburiae]ELR9541510.1 DUF4123 domain-containing protein [Enterobacter asburiae]MDW3572046.1 DUF4123 domain-containing protein [Enterobacter asburiae]WIK22585.1 DUF4123 domain-containing protein [Enterobacter asburiae]BCT19964.1 hypothetical protein R2TS_31360 [Enterobacter asburiae]